jgi:hypothetical protein
MYRLTTRVSLGALLLCCVAQFAAAQDQPPVFSMVACIDTKPGLDNEYEEFALDTQKKIAGVQDPSSNRVGWILLRSVIPAGDNAACNFMVVNVFSGFPKWSSLSLGDRIKKAGLNMTEEEFRAKRNSLSSLADRKLWQRIDGLEAPKVGNFIMLNMAKVHDWAEWIDIERNVWHPVAEELAKHGKRVSWGAYRLVMPSGTSLPYDGASIDVFADWDSLGGNQGVNAAIQKVHPNMSSDLLSSRIERAREFVRHDLYRVVGQVTF